MAWFWFKLTCTISFTDGVFREGVGIFDYSKNSFNEVLIISQIAIFSFILSGYFREFFLFKYPKNSIYKILKITFLNLEGKNMVNIYYFIHYNRNFKLSF